MDSVTQFALGATVGAAVLGRRLGLRKAAITGGLLATLPDLDVFWPESDPVERFVTHRSATHSLLMHALVTPVLGEGLRRTMSGLKELPWRRGVTLAWGAVFLCLTTHALLDATTIYGTQLLWPLNRIPYAVGSMFIIDPVYTIPLLVMTVWALIRKQYHAGYGRGLAAALVVSTGYLVWSIFAQQMIEERGRQVLEDAGLGHDQIIATPTPFNTMFWRVIAVDHDRYYNIYLPVLGKKNETHIYQQTRFSPGLNCWLNAARERGASVARLADFSQGFFALLEDNNDITYADLRMGMTPYFVFNYKVAERQSGIIVEKPAVRISGLPRAAEGDWLWLLAGAQGDMETRPAERAQRMVPRVKAEMTKADGINAKKDGRC
ncbi:MAG: metal-dependent hydrolase [Alphaproteobacteria bacterium]|nr:metal-dependent hydrolase [Alphaproteobacteria bacterium]MBT4082968.1 metal-dependent hydrolase [Alphaproteobacteria bacterium]MBT4543439.1 metal-dependent hydrolase [Alphaproteobacteria bacterium]MBT7745667.1 metal-dependent hydrolase [Alphaproteobacteria bacterium]